MNEKRSEILGNICFALNTSNIDVISKLAKSAFDAEYKVEEIKIKKKEYVSVLHVMILM